MDPEFRASERSWGVPRLTCGECGGKAEGNVTCGHEDICDACDRKLTADDAAVES